MKKLLALIILFCTITILVGCSTSTPQSEPQTYTTYGRYYTDGTVITNDGNEWAYTTDKISDQAPTDAMPIWIAFNDNGTPNDIYDDVILGVVYDRNTAVYDALEVALSDSFSLEREGNYIMIVTDAQRTDNGIHYTFADGTGYYMEY